MIIYLACPYIHEDKKIMEDRFLNVTRCAAHFMDRGQKIYSPITHGHTINEYMKQLPGDHRYWLDQCYHHVITAEALYVLCLDGWFESTGVRWEIETAWAFKIPVFTIDADIYELQQIYKSGWSHE